jgi:hypothetical protein
MTGRLDEIATALAGAHGTSDRRRWGLRGLALVLVVANLLVIHLAHQALAGLEQQGVRPRVQRDAGSGDPIVLVPPEAVTNRGGKTVVVAVVDNRAKIIAVALGAERGGAVIVRTGLTGAETLVRHPPDAMQDGDRIQVKRPTP